MRQYQSILFCCLSIASFAGLACADSHKNDHSDWLNALPASSSFKQTGEIYRRSIDLDGSGIRDLYQEIQSQGLASTLNWNAVNLLLIRWAEVDPEGMLSHIIDTPSTNCMPLVDVLFDSWPQSDLNAAQAGALKLTGLEHRRAVERTVHYWIRHDYIASLDWLSSNFSGQSFAHLYNRIFYSWAKDDAHAALETALVLPENPLKSSAIRGILTHIRNERGFGNLDTMLWLDSLPQSSAIDDAKHAVFRYFMQRDFAGALAYIESLPTPLIRQRFVDRMISAGIIRELDVSEVELFLDWIGEETSGQRYVRKISSNIGSMTEKDSSHTQQFIGQMPAGEARRTAIAGYVQTLSRTDPASALEYALEITDETERNRALRSLTRAFVSNDIHLAAELVANSNDTMAYEILVPAVVNEWALIDWQSTLAWVETLNQNDKAGNIGIITLLRLWIQSDPSAALEYASRTLDDADLRTALIGAYSHWSQVNPQEAIRWLNDFPESLHESAQGVIFSNVARNFLNYYPDEVPEWLNSLNAGPNRDAAVIIQIQHILKGDPGEAFAWAQTIDNPDRRMNFLRTALSNWMAIDFEAAESALKLASIDEDEKDSLKLLLRPN